MTPIEIALIVVGYLTLFLLICQFMGFNNRPVRESEERARRLREVKERARAALGE